MALMMSAPIRSAARAAGVSEPDQKTEDILSKISKIDTSNDLDKDQVLARLSAELYATLDDDKSRIFRAQNWIKVVLVLNILVTVFTVLAVLVSMLGNAYLPSIMNVPYVKATVDLVMSPDGDIRAGFLVVLGMVGALTISSKLLTKTQREENRRDFIKEVVVKHVELKREKETREANQA